MTDKRTETEGRTNGMTDKPNSIYPPPLFQSGAIMNNYDKFNDIYRSMNVRSFYYMIINNFFCVFKVKTLDFF